jgi:hypothetical protein
MFLPLIYPSFNLIIYASHNSIFQAFQFFTVNFFNQAAIFVINFLYSLVFVWLFHIIYFFLIKLALISLRYF